MVVGRKSLCETCQQWSTFLRERQLWSVKHNVAFHFLILLLLRKHVNFLFRCVCAQAVFDKNHRFLLDSEMSFTVGSCSVCSWLKSMTLLKFHRVVWLFSELCVSRSIRVNRVSSACFAIPTSLEFRVQSRKRVSTKLIASTCSGTEKVCSSYCYDAVTCWPEVIVRLGQCLQAVRVWCWPLLKFRRSRTTEIRTSSSSPWTERVVWFPEVIKQTPENK